jgi:hypothetical protein
MEIRRRRFLRALTAGAATATVFAFAGAGSAQASQNQLSFMMDDALLLYRSDATREATLDLMKGLGVDGVRVVINWSVIAEKSRATPTARRRFRGDDSTTYTPLAIWDRYDRLVQGAAARGMVVLFSVTGPGPPWSRGAGGRGLPDSYRPNVTEFYKFVKALGKRYSGTEADNHGRALPRVALWSLWNEPNQYQTLTPQSEFNRTAGRVIPTAPILYRSLVLAALRGLRETGHGRDFIFLGETAPLGSDKKGPREQLRPKEFIREFFCLRPNGGRYTGRQARARGCSAWNGNKNLPVVGWAHHPYTQRNHPTARSPHRNSLNMANIADLGPLMDLVARRTGILRPGMLVALTELGYQTMPPDVKYGIPLAKQSEFNNVADWLAYRNQRVILHTHFLLRDTEPLTRFRKNSAAYWSTWQSGLYFLDNRPKPSAFAYMMPLHVTVRRRQGAGARVNVWGQIRFLPDGTKDKVYLQYRPQGGLEWYNAPPAVEVTNSKGFWEIDTFQPAPGAWRAVWAGADGRTFLVSREVPVRY